MIATTATSIKAVLIITSHILKLRLGAAFIVLLLAFLVVVVVEEACFMSASSPAPDGAAAPLRVLPVILLSVVGVGVGDWSCELWHAEIGGEHVGVCGGVVYESSVVVSEMHHDVYRNSQGARPSKEAKSSSAADHTLEGTYGLR